MKPVICMCCGQPILPVGPAAPSNPNLCLACSRIVDDIQDSTLIESAIPYELDDAAQAAPAENPSPEAESSKPAQARNETGDSSKDS